MDRSNEEDEFPSTQVENGVPERKELYCEILKYPTVGSFSDVIIENLTNEDIIHKDYKDYKYNDFDLFERLII